MKELSFPTEPVREIEIRTLEALEREVIKTRQPLRVRGLTEEWPAVRRWTTEHLREQLASSMLAVYASPDRFFPGENHNPSDGISKAREGRRTVRMSGEDLFRRLAEEGDARYYAHACDLAPALADAIPLAGPERIDIGKFMWMSGPGHTTPTHFDGSDNLLVNIVGEKRVVLFEPAHFENLYVHGVDHRYSRHSQVFDLEAIDHEQFPRTRHLRGLTTTLGPGDALYIPNFWWHAVETTRAAVSVNFWWNSEPFPGYADLLEAWLPRRRELLDALPADMPERMKAYFLRLLLFVDLR
jgi:hypothetical protein